MDKGYIEELAQRALNAIGHSSGAVSLSEICRIERQNTGIEVQFDVELPSHVNNRNILGQINFDPLEISIYKQTPPHLGRERFTLAHELGHYFLQHGIFISQEFCEEGDFGLEAFDAMGEELIQRIEWQANFFAVCLLVPKAEILKAFHFLAKQMNLVDKGFGLLYVDGQQCNRQNYFQITSVLKEHFCVSRKVIANRLEDLGLLNYSIPLH